MVKKTIQCTSFPSVCVHVCECTGILRLPRSFQEEECVHVRLQRKGDSLAVQYQCYIERLARGPWIQGECQQYTQTSLRLAQFLKVQLTYQWILIGLNLNHHY